MKVYDYPFVYILDGDERTIVSTMFKGVVWKWKDEDGWMEERIPQEYFDEHA